eukprot:jgi/Chlat1/1708/Chrsp127S01937
MNSGPAGFYHAPVIKTVVLATTALSLFAGITRNAQSFNLSRLAVLRRREWWRVLTSGFVFSSPGEIIFGLYLLYYFRIFERQVGSSKFGAYTVITLALSSLLQVASLVIQSDSRPLASGPYGLIFASFVPFLFDIPHAARFSVFGLRLSDKVFIYVAGLQMLLSQGRASIVSGLCGLLAGLTHRSNILGLRHFEFPSFVNNLVASILRPIIASSPPTVTATRRVAEQNGARRPPRVRTIGMQAGQGFTDQLVGGSGPELWGNPPGQGSRRATPMNPSAPPAQAVPSEENIEALVAMGFDREVARRALVNGNNDITVATHLLLDSGPS